MKQKCIALLLASSALFTPVAAQAIGVVDFKACLEESKLGKAEQNAFNGLKDQMNSILEKTERDLEDIVKKLEDSEYMDSLSETAQKELQDRFQSLSQEMGRYQNQYYQILNQAQLRLLQELQGHVADGSAIVAKSKNLTLVLNQEACFFFQPTLDVTKEVVKEMDLRFDREEAEAKANPQVDPAATPAPAATPGR